MDTSHSPRFFVREILQLRLPEWRKEGSKGCLSQGSPLSRYSPVRVDSGERYAVSVGPIQHVCIAICESYIDEISMWYPIAP